MQHDRHPLVVCRVDCPDELLAELDDWIPSHFDDSLVHDAMLDASSYAIRRDYAAQPALLNGQGNRFIVYTAASMEHLRAWYEGSAAREAIDDGEARERAYHPLDGEPFTGNTYEPVETWRRDGAAPPPGGPIVAERFEVPDGTPGFDAWLDGPHQAAARSWPGAVRVRTFRQVSDLPDRFPYDRYASKGNRMLLVELEPGTELASALADERLRASLEDSLRWDLTLPYVRREACEQRTRRTKADVADRIAAAAGR